jgi:hypothetical protein
VVWRAQEGLVASVEEAPLRWRCSRLFGGRVLKVAQSGVFLFVEPNSKWLVPFVGLYDPQELKIAEV